VNGARTILGAVVSAAMLVAAPASADSPSAQRLLSNWKSDDWHGRQIAGAIMLHSEKAADRGLALGDAVEVAHRGPIAQFGRSRKVSLRAHRVGDPRSLSL
jgi:hypothetical protein